MIFKGALKFNSLPLEPSHLSINWAIAFFKQHMYSYANSVPTWCMVYCVQGEAFKDRIAEAYYKSESFSELHEFAKSSTGQAHLNRWKDAVERYPNVVAEMKGLADGSGIDYEEVWCLCRVLATATIQCRHRVLSVESCCSCCQPHCSTVTELHVHKLQLYFV